MDGWVDGRYHDRTLEALSLSHIRGYRRFSPLTTDSHSLPWACTAFSMLGIRCGVHQFVCIKPLSDFLWLGVDLPSWGVLRGVVTGVVWSTTCLRGLPTPRLMLFLARAAFSSLRRFSRVVSLASSTSTYKGALFLAISSSVILLNCSLLCSSFLWTPAIVRSENSAL